MPYNSPAPLSTQIVVKRADVIDALQARIDAARTSLDTFAKEVNKEIEEQESIIKSVKKWYLDVSKGLRNGTYEVNDKGALVDATSKRAISGKPTRKSQDGEVSRLKNMLENVQTAHDRAVAPLVNALNMLALTQQEEIEVATGDYQGLLAIEFNASDYRRGYYW